MKKLFAIAVAMVFAFCLAGKASAAGDAAKGGENWGSKKCKNCHNLDEKKKVGPGLGGVTKRRSEAWMKKWLADPDKTWEENDAETAAMKKEVGSENAKKTKMKISKLTEAEIDDLLAYVKANGG
jgi:cytochrome c2